MMEKGNEGRLKAGESRVGSDVIAICGSSALKDGL